MTITTPPFVRTSGLVFAGEGWNLVPARGSSVVRNVAVSDDLTTVAVRLSDPNRVYVYRPGKHGALRFITSESLGEAYNRFLRNRAGVPSGSYDMEADVVTTPRLREPITL